MKDLLGDKLKKLEEKFPKKVSPTEILYVRLDGRSFSKFSRGFDKPYDVHLYNLMNTVAHDLAEHTSASLIYHQSDEISIMWVPKSTPGFEHMFGGKTQKISSVLASFAAASFMRELNRKVWQGDIPADKIDMLPHFDCRVVAFDTVDEALDMFYWRNQDAVRNGITGAANAFYSHKELQKKNTLEKLAMLNMKGIDYANVATPGFPNCYKTGTYLFPGMEEVSVDQTKIHPQFWPASGVVMRRRYFMIDFLFKNHWPNGNKDDLIIKIKSLLNGKI